MAEEYEAQQPYKCAVCGEKFDSQEQLQEHLKKCRQRIAKQKQKLCASLMIGHGAIPRDRSSRNHVRGVQVSVIAHPRRLIDETGPRHRCSERDNPSFIKETPDNDS